MPKLSETLSHLFHPRRSNNHRPRVLHPEGLLILIMISFGFFGFLKITSYWERTGRGILGYASSITPSDVVRSTNQERVRAGLSPLQVNDRLSQAAQAKGQDMFTDQYWAHTSPDGTEPWYFIKQSGYGYKVAGENLARDFSDTGSMVQAWMASPTHRANILNNKYQEIGIAVIDGTLQGYETTLVVQMFGTPTSVVPAVNSDTAAASVPAPTPAVAAVEQTNETANDLAAVPPAAVAPAGVLATALVPIGSLETPPLFTPLQLTKAFFLAIIMLIITTLTYDTVVIGHRNTMRMVGKNMAHIMLFMVVAFLLIFFKGGLID